MITIEVKPLTKKKDSHWEYVVRDGPRIHCQGTRPTEKEANSQAKEDAKTAALFFGGHTRQLDTEQDG